MLSFVKILCKTRVREKTPVYRGKTPVDWVKTPGEKLLFFGVPCQPPLH